MLTTVSTGFLARIPLRVNGRSLDSSNVRFMMFSPSSWAYARTIELKGASDEGSPRTAQRQQNSAIRSARREPGRPAGDDNRPQVGPPARSTASGPRRTHRPGRELPLRAADVDRLLIELRALAFSSALDPADALRRIRDAFREAEGSDEEADQR